MGADRRAAVRLADAPRSPQGRKARAGGCSRTGRCCGIRCFRSPSARPAILRGLHRRFCLYSLASRGTPQKPGLVLGLDRGGACTGVVYRLPAPVAMDELHLLWRREMVVGAYRPRWVRVRSGERELGRADVRRPARRIPQYAGNCRSTSRPRVIADIERRVRVVARLPRAHARRAGDARHRRSVSRETLAAESGGAASGC